MTSTNVMSFSVTWFVTFSVFLMNVQLGRNYVERDAVDHAAAVAADTAMKTYCDSNLKSASSGAAASASVAGILEMVGDKQSCSVTVKEVGVNALTGGRDLDVLVHCQFECKIPFASQAMCTDGHVNFEKHQHTVAMGCDAS